MNRIKQYITEQEYLYYLSRGIPYRGYVIGVGYAYEQYAQVPYSIEGVARVYKLQKMDTSPQAVLESLEGKALDKLVREENGLLWVNMGNGTTVKTSKKSEVRLDMSAFGDQGKYQMTITDPITQKQHKVIGNTEDLAKTIQEGEEKGLTMENFERAVGTLSLTVDIMEKLYRPEYYKPKKGPNAGQWTEVFKRTKGNALRYHFDKKIPKNIKFVSKLAKAHYLRGLLIRKIGRGLGILGVGLTASNIMVNGKVSKKDALDLVFGVIAFITPGGWIISGAYFILDLTGVVDNLLEEHNETILKRSIHEEHYRESKIDKLSIDRSSFTKYKESIFLNEESLSDKLFNDQSFKKDREKSLYEKMQENARKARHTEFIPYYKN